MQHFTGMQYLQIDVANCFGLDRLNWDDRLHWFANNEPHLEDISVQAKNPILFRKAVRAMRAAQKGKPINHVMGLDATASGLQLMGVLSGCESTCRATNLINTGKREDVYDAVASTMNSHPHVAVRRDTVKKPVMTVFYGSTAQPKAIFGEGPVLDAFYDALQEKLPGAYELMGIMQRYWNPMAREHRWTLPDGHVACVPVTITTEKSLEIDEAAHLRFIYRTKIVHAKPHSRSLAANIVHSIDGFVVRQMVQAAYKQGFQLAPIHDCFYAHPNYMNQVRENYVKILEWIAKRNLIQRILSELAGYKVAYFPKASKIPQLILQSEYALS